MNNCTLVFHGKETNRPYSVVQLLNVCGTLVIASSIKRAVYNVSHLLGKFKEPSG